MLSLPLGHLALISSHKALTTVPQFGCIFTDGKRSLMILQTSSVVFLFCFLFLDKGV